MVEPVTKPTMVVPTGDPAAQKTAAYIDAVRLGMASADGGRTIPYEKVRHWLLSWGTEHPLPPPMCS